MKSQAAEIRDGVSNVQICCGNGSRYNYESEYFQVLLLMSWSNANDNS
jgi:putative component of toxin-antitoxin plasmid stabilization module